MQVKGVLALLGAIIIAVFALQNTEPVTVHLLFYTVPGVSSALLILVTAAVAAGCTLLLGIGREFEHRSQVGALRKALAVSDARVAQLEAQAVAVPSPLGAQLQAPVGEGTSGEA